MDKVCLTDDQFKAAWKEHWNINNKPLATLTDDEKRRLIELREMLRGTKYEPWGDNLPNITVRLPDNYNETGSAHGSSVYIGTTKLNNLCQFTLTFPVGGSPVVLNAEINAVPLGTTSNNVIFEGPATVNLTVVSFHEDFEVVARKDGDTWRYTLESRKGIMERWPKASYVESLMPQRKDDDK